MKLLTIALTLAVLATTATASENIEDNEYYTMEWLKAHCEMKGKIAGAIMEKRQLGDDEEALSALVSSDPMAVAIVEDAYKYTKYPPEYSEIIEDNFRQKWEKACMMFMLEEDK